MALLNTSGRVVIAQVVFAGPGLSGKTTNLRWLAERLPATPFTEFPTRHERTAFMDELPLDVAVGTGGWRLAVSLQTVPGQANAQAAEARRVVLRRPDVIVFVADSDPRRMDANRLALHDVRSILAPRGRIDEELPPLIFQYNKQDVAGAVTPEHLDAVLNPTGATRVLAEAVRGVGVIDTLKVAVERVRERVLEEFEQVT
jgi:signal recognition particle receptor subunit beta